MGHSHIPVAHLVKQVEISRSQGQRRDLRPPWISPLIQRVAELFEPTSDVARAGFDCRWDEDRWHIGMYLGKTEIVGGRDDGDCRHPGFEFDLRRLLEMFGLVERLVWSARPPSPLPPLPRGEEPGERDNADLPTGSFLTLDGLVDDNPVRLQIFSIAPATAGPGLREYADGRRDPV